MTFGLLFQKAKPLFIRGLALLAFILISGFNLHAQKINGMIKEAGTSQPLIGVTVTVKGTSTGTVSDFDGKYALDASSTDVLVFSFIGYETQEVLVGEQKTIDVWMEEEAINLDAVTVTALGIKRESKALGYSTQEIDGKSLTEAKEVNFVNALNGKVAGVNITQGGSGVGSSSRIVIRGESSLSGNNQPLFVVNGIPINNTNGGNGRNEGNLEADYGNGASEINSDDVESITVLKGANATALYGSRAANGVILVTTKNGKGKKGIGISVNSNVTIDNPLRIPQYQNKYGQGAGGQFEFVDGFGSGLNDNIDESWGPPLDGRMKVQHYSTKADGTRAGDFLSRPSDYSDQGEFELLPWSPHPDNIKNFFETGVTTTNNIAIYGGDDVRNFRLSYGNMNSKGILPNTDLRRNTINLDASHNFLDKKLTVNTNINYINSASNNRPNNSYGTENVMYLWVWFGRHIPMESLKNYWQKGYENVQQFNYNYNWHDNPYFTMNENTNAFDKNRVFGNINATYQFTPSLSLMVRSGMDFFNDLRVGKRAWSTQRFPKGQYREDKIYFMERNTDFLLSYNKRMTNKFSLTASFGGNQMTQENRYHRVSANELAIPAVYSFNNSAIALSSNQYNSKKRINSLYALASFGFNDALYLELAGRNDWASTLPVENNSYFYPAVSLSFVANEVLNLPESISFAKLRAGWGQVGNDTDPYSINSYFDFLTTPYGDNLLGTESNTLANADLKPEKASTLEVGADIRLFKSRLGLDISYYNTSTINQILQIPVSQTSGYGAKYINAGNIASQGIEAVLHLRPVEKKSFSWDMDVNFTRSRSEVKELAEGLETYQVASNYLQVLAKVGGRMGDVYGTGFVYVDTNTGEQVEVNDVADIKDSYEVLYNASNGQPVRDPNLRRLGNYNPDFTLGVYNTLHYKNFSLGFLFDWHNGGVVNSRTLLIGGTSGMMIETAEFDRDTHEFIGEGVKEAADGSYVTNDVVVSARDFYWSHYNRGNEQVGMYDATYVKLREAKLSYKLPAKVATKVGAQSLTLSLVGRNLLLWTENPHFDPEVFSFNGSTIVPGVEDMATPSTRSFGVNLNVQF